MSAAALVAAADRLLGRVSHWTPQRWSQPAHPQPGGSDGSRAGRDGEGSRADCVFALVQGLADLAADAEGASARTVPRLDNDLALPDQLRVMVADLVAVAARPDVYQRAVAIVNDTARRL